MTPVPDPAPSSDSLKGLPRNFLIGAAKSGTTALARTLGTHPALFLPPEKEPGFFSNDRHWAEGVAWYRSRYSGMSDAQTGIDASTMSLYAPEAPDRFVEIYPDPDETTLIAMLRNPVDRAYSAYWQALNFGWIPEGTTFEAALEQETALLARRDASASGRTVGAFVDAGRYAVQLKRWYQALGHDRIELILKDDFDADPDAVYARVLARIGVPPDSGMHAGLVANRASLPRLAWLNALYRGRHPLLRRLREPLPRDLKLWLKRRLDRVNQREIDYQPMQADTRAMLLERFAPENRALTKLTGLDLSRWEL